MLHKLRIAEIFSSIQGEGIWVGVPSTFVRISGCNLRCSWCDTKYASWYPEGETHTVDEIALMVKKADIQHVVITGGEPLLFDGVKELATLLSRDGFLLTFETAGTVFRELPCHLMSISPKLSNSTPLELKAEGWVERHESTRKNLVPLKQLVAYYDAVAQLKFVVNPEGDMAELEEISAILNFVCPRKAQILLMAEGTDPETLHRRERMLVPICLQRGWRLSPRLHVDLFGNTRGT